MSRPRIYLAGPEVFLPDALAVGREKCRRAEVQGLQGLFPLDVESSPDLVSERARAQAIFRSNWALMQQADGCIANLTPFRGPGADPGTVFEVGAMLAWGKPVIAYSLDARDYRQRVEGQGVRDLQGLEVEDFGLADNLMLEASIEQAGGRLLRGHLKQAPALSQWPGWELYEQALALWRARFAVEAAE